MGGGSSDAIAATGLSVNVEVQSVVIVCFCALCDCGQQYRGNGERQTADDAPVIAIVNSTVKDAHLWPEAKKKKRQRKK